MPSLFQKPLSNHHLISSQSVLLFLSLLLTILPLFVSSSSHVSASLSSVSANAKDQVVAQLLEKEAEALLNWKATLLDNNNHSLFSSWAGSTPCNWIGVACDESSVAYLELSSFSLRGTLHNLSFSSFPNLLVLDLFNNSLYGSIPQELGFLHSLVYLDLSSNNLTGSIPASLGNLKNLTGLYLFENNLSGSIPHELGFLRSLGNLSLSSNNLTGSIPTSLGNLGNLTILYLFENNLSGSIPHELGFLHSLVELDLSSNNLTGSIPASLENLRNLTHLYLFKNNLYGFL